MSNGVEVRLHACMVEACCTSEWRFKLLWAAWACADGVVAALPPRHWQLVGNAARSGGCISSEASSLRLADSVRVSHCSATFGGAVWLDGSPLSAERNVSFGPGNAAANQGGSIFASSNHVHLSDGVEVRDGSATDGAGVYLFDSARLLAERNVTFARNRARGRGGGICALRFSSVHLSDGVQLREGGAYSGSAVFVSESSLTAARDVSVLDSSAQNAGSIVVIGEDSRLSLSEVRFRNTSARVGGAVYFESLLATNELSSDLSHHTISNCSFAF